MSFADQIAAFTKKAAERQDRVLQGVVKEVGERLVERTPVDAGEARSNWQASVNSPVAIHTPDLDPTGAGAIADIGRVADRAKFGDAVYVLNAAPHIKSLEDGHSKQAPAGMVAVTVVEGRQIIDEVARKVAAGAGTGEGQ
ncbi:hypothetical protein [Elstera cyanobacteriorum]|uniref:hypothetical protein n=1 Tax=Elstera cyanobacteriorum TaxID=2022747 RepID=UPI002352D1F2|nr:hypothetical protein [Elstera cyanobacteriorum]MCK6444415.1 hypothetical protein [Elstera cyanobacteriorum]